MSDDDLRYERDEFSQDHDDEDEEGGSGESRTNPYSSAGGRPQPPASRQPYTADEVRRTNTNPTVGGGGGAPQRPAGWTPSGGGGSGGYGGGSPSSGVPPRPNPPASGGGYGGGNPSSGVPPRPNPPASSGGYGGGNPSSGVPPRPNNPAGSGSGYGSGVNPRPSSNADALPTSSAAQRTGTGPLNQSGSGGGSNPPGGQRTGTGPLNQSGGGGGSNPPGGQRPGTGPLNQSGGGGGSNPPGGQRPPGGSPTPKDDKKPEAKKDDAPKEGGGNPLSSAFGKVGGLFNRGGGDDKDKKPDDKKDDKKPESKKDDAPKEGGAGIGSRLSGLFNRGGGDDKDKKPDAKPDDKKPVPPPSAGGAGAPKPAGSGGAPSMGAGAQSAGAPMPTFGGGGTPPASGAPKSPVTGTASSTATKSVSDPAKKPDAKKDDGAAPAAAGGLIAGLMGRLPFGKKADAPAEPAAGAKTAAASTKPAAGATSQTKQQAAKAQAEQATGGGGIWERLTGRGPKAATEPQSRTLREGNQRLPQADTSGWNLDTKLDLIGIGLILAALTLLLSALSAEQANVTGSINRFIGQLFGWGALAVPLTMGYVGVFLLVTRFGDTPPELDMVRLAGLVLAFLVALTIFQYVEVLAPRYQCDIDCFRIVVQRSFLEGRGGGVVGMNIHLFLIENIGEIAGFVLVVGLAVLSGMLMTRTTATELMVLFVSLYRSFRVSWQHQAQRRAASRQIAAQKRAEAAARISVSRPAALEVGRAPALGSEARQPALPLGASQEPMFRVGGQVISASGAPNAPATASAAPSAGNPLKGLLSRIPRPAPKTAEASPTLQPTGVVQQVSGLAQASAPTAQAQPQPSPFAPPPPPPTPASTAPALAANAPVPPPAAPRPTADGPTVAANTPIELPKPPAPVMVHSSTPRTDYKVPEFRQILNPGSKADYDRKALVERARIIQETLESFGAPGKVVEINTGPVITQFGVEPGYVMQRDRQSRVKVSAIAQLDKDLQLALGARSIRIEAPVPGKGYVGIEVPNDSPMTVSLRDVLESNRYQRIRTPLAIALGESVDGTPVAADLSSMPHLLIAGTTGSGKSVCVNAIIASLLLRNTPEQVKFIMVDPKRVELTGYNGIPHLIAPVVVEVERIIGVLKWLTREMDERYKKFSVAGARNIEDYNRNRPAESDALPYIVAIIDELADLMMLAPEEAERYITRIAAMARATGIHLVIATQRPSADVVTGLIKANFPARIAFAVAGNVDSRVILDQPGAEKLLGRGDMLFLSADSPAAQRLQGVFVSDSELSSIIRYWKAQTADQPQKPALSFGADDDKPARSAPQPSPRTAAQQEVLPRGLFDDLDEDAEDDIDDEGSGIDDDLFERAVELVRRQNGASVSLLQRKMRIGYARAARLIDAMEERGIIGPQKENSSKQREVLK